VNGLRPRPLGLYLRSRGVPLTAAIVIAATAICWGLTGALSDQPQAGRIVVALTILLATLPVASTLAGPDEALERTAAVRWPVRRAVHLFVALAVVTGTVLATRATDVQFGPPWVVFRDAAGLLGMVAACTAIVGVQRAWIVPTIWTFVVVVFYSEPGGSPRDQVFTWIVQVPMTRMSTLTAGVLAVAGLLAYALAGSPSNPASDPNGS
jgi:hypothetical protein